MDYSSNGNMLQPSLGYTHAMENMLSMEDEANKVKKIRTSCPWIGGLCAVSCIFRDYAKLCRNSYWTYGAAL